MGIRPRRSAVTPLRPSELRADLECIFLYNLLQGSSYVITAGDNFFWEPISNKNIHKVVLDREVSLATVELKPKVFHVQNLLSKEEAEYIFLMAKAKAKKSMDDNRARTKVVFESGLPYLFGDAIFDRVFQRVMNLTHSHNTIVEPEVRSFYPAQSKLLSNHTQLYMRFSFWICFLFLDLVPR